MAKRFNPNCLVIRLPDRGGVSFEYVQSPPGKKRYFRGRYVGVVKQVDGHFDPYEPPDKIVCPPDELYGALRWSEARRLLTYHPSLLDKVNMWLGITLVGILLLFIFVLIAP